MIPQHAEMNPRGLELLLDRNFDLKTPFEYLVTVFRGAHGYVAARARLSQRDGLFQFEWELGIAVDQAETRFKDGGKEVETRLTTGSSYLRNALRASISAARYLALYSPDHARELWGILNVGLTAKLPIIDALVALDAPSE